MAQDKLFEDGSKMGQNSLKICLSKMAFDGPNDLKTAQDSSFDKMVITKIGPREGSK